MTLDRVDSDRFSVTKEFLAQLLGTNRPTVSVLVSVLEKAFRGGTRVQRRPVGLFHYNEGERTARELRERLRCRGRASESARRFWRTDLHAQYRYRRVVRNFTLIHQRVVSRPSVLLCLTEVPFAVWSQGISPLACPGRGA
jgi:hypothetical protein